MENLNQEEISAAVNESEKVDQIQKALVEEYIRNNQEKILTQAKKAKERESAVTEKLKGIKEKAKADFESVALNRLMSLNIDSSAKEFDAEIATLRELKKLAVKYQNPRATGSGGTKTPRDYLLLEIEQLVAQKVKTWGEIIKNLKEKYKDSPEELRWVTDGKTRLLDPRYPKKSQLFPEKGKMYFIVGNDEFATPIYA